MSAAGGRRPCKLLVVEDDLDVRESLRDVLTDAGYQVVCAEEGGRALTLMAEEAPPAAILLDLTMPGMDGHQFLAELRRRPGGRAVPVLVLTAQSTVFEVRVPDAAAVVRKPIDLDQLLALVSTVTGG